MASRLGSDLVFLKRRYRCLCVGRKGIHEHRGFRNGERRTNETIGRGSF